jgi:hypothetical protein
MKVIPGNQFPVEGYDNFTKQIVPRWTNTDAAIIAAYTALVDKICPCVLLFHSQAGGFGFTVHSRAPTRSRRSLQLSRRWPAIRPKPAP